MAPQGHESCVTALLSAGPAGILSRPDVIFDLFVSLAARQDEQGRRLGELRQGGSGCTAERTPPPQAPAPVAAAAEGRLAELEAECAAQRQQLQRHQRAISLLSRQQWDAERSGSGAPTEASIAPHSPAEAVLAERVTRVEARAAGIERMIGVLGERVEVCNQLSEAVRSGSSGRAKDDQEEAAAAAGELELQRQHAAQQEARLGALAQKAEMRSTELEDGLAAAQRQITSLTNVVLGMQQEQRRLGQALASAESGREGGASSRDVAWHELARRVRELAERLAATEGSQQSIRTELGALAADLRRTQQGGDQQEGRLAAAAAASASRIAQLQGRLDDIDHRTDTAVAAADLLRDRMAAADGVVERAVSGADLAARAAADLRDLFEISGEDVRWAVTGDPRDRLRVLHAAPAFAFLLAAVQRLDSELTAQAAARGPAHPAPHRAHYHPPLRPPAAPGSAPAGERAAGGRTSPPARSSPASPRPSFGLRLTADSGGAQGLRVAAVTQGGPAEAAGLRGGDRILTVNGAAVRSRADFSSAAAAQGGGGGLRLMRVAPGAHQADEIVIPPLEGRPGGHSGRPPLQPSPTHWR